MQLPMPHRLAEYTPLVSSEILRYFVRYDCIGPLSLRQRSNCTFSPSVTFFNFITQPLTTLFNLACVLTVLLLDMDLVTLTMRC